MICDVKPKIYKLGEVMYVLIVSVYDYNVSVYVFDPSSGVGVCITCIRKRKNKTHATTIAQAAKTPSTSQPRSHGASGVPR